MCILPRVYCNGRLLQEIDFDRLTKNGEIHHSWEDDQFEPLFPLRIIQEVEKWREDASDGFKRRDFELVRLYARENNGDTPAATDPCSKYCSAHCPNVS